MDRTRKQRSGIFVTGATGHLGYHLLEALHGEGVRPRVLVRGELEPDVWEQFEVEPVVADLETSSPEDLATLLTGIETVYHLAALVSLLPSDAERIDRINRRGTEILFEACRLAGVRRFVFVSVAASVGVSSDGCPRDESSSWNLGGLRVPYIQSKLAAERCLLERAATESGSPEVIVANPSLLVGPPRAVGRRNLGIPRGLRRGAFSGLLHFYVEGRMNLVDVRDVAGALIRLARTGRPGHRYLLTGATVSIREILDLIGEFVPLGRVRIRLPRRVLVWAATLGSVMDRAQSDTLPNLSPPSTTPTSVPDCFRLLEYHWSFSTEKAREEIGFIPTPLEDSLRDLFDWASLQQHVV